MSLLLLGVVFAVIIALLAFHRPLWTAMLAGISALSVLFRIGPLQGFRLVSQVFTNWNSCSVLVSLYLITYLQRMLAARNQISLAQQDLNVLFHNRRVNATGAPLFIGLLPSAAAMILCGDIVKEATDGYLKPEEQAFVTSWVRHIPESALPTYPGVLLMLALSGVSAVDFLPGMIIPMIVLGLLAYYPFIRRLPRDPGMIGERHRTKALRDLLKHLWTLLLILVLILFGRLSVVAALLVVILSAIPVYRFRTQELLTMLKSAFEPKLIANTFLVLVLKEFIAETGTLNDLPTVLSMLPIPAYLVFALMFFLGGIISGASGIIALGTPLAFAALDTGMPLMVLLMCMTHAASQISPTHVCLAVASDYYGIPLGALVRKTLPRALIFCGLMILYYNLLVRI